MQGFRKLIVTCLVAAATLGLASHRVWAADAKKEEKKEADTPLAKKMEEMDEGMKKLRRTLRDAKQNKESIATIKKVKADAVACKDLVPVKAKSIPEAEREKWLADYRKGMEKLVSSMTEMETALGKDDNAKAQDIYKSLKKQEEEGHKVFTEE